jgi:hypothetical protein
MKFNKISLVVTLSLVFFTNKSIIMAQDCDSVRLPSIGSHVFTSIAGVDDPFIKTKFNLSIGLANLINTEIPIEVPAIDETYLFKPELFYTVGGFEYQHAVKDWAAIHLKVGALARVGNNAVSIATQGISAAATTSVGLIFKLVENDKLSLSGGIDLNTSSLTYVDLAGKFEDLINDSSSTTQVINNYELLAGNLGFRFAFKYNEIFGLLANASVIFGEIYARDSQNEFNWKFGSLLSIDLRNWINIPFGIGIGGTAVSNDWQYSENNKPVYTANLNISFMNKNDFSIGLENYIQIVYQHRFEETYNFHYTKIYLSYYF